MADQVLPANQMAEQAVLGAIILDGTLFPKAAELTADDFDRPRHKPIWLAMQSIVAEGRLIDHITLRDAMAARGALPHDVDGYMAELMVAPAMPTSLPYYVGIVADKAARRRAVGALQTALASVLDESTDLGSVLTGAAGELGRIAAGGPSSYVSSYDLVLRTVERIQAAHTARQEYGAAWVPGLRTGLELLDVTIGGFERGGYHIIAGETSMGKSAFALTRALHFAEEHDEPGVVISLEDQEPTMGLRVLSGATRTNAQDLRFGNARDIQFWERLTRGSTRMSNLPVRWVFDAYTLPAVLRAMRQAKEQAGATWCVVDYLQMIEKPAEGRARPENRTLELGAISKALRIAAKELNMAVLALSQVSRMKGRADRRPHLSDLRDSGSLEQDANTVLFVSRPGKDAAPNSEISKEWPPEKTELIVAKNKNGPLYDIHLRFEKETMTFHPWHETVTL